MRRYTYTLVETNYHTIEVEAENGIEAQQMAEDEALSWTLGGEYNSLEFEFSEPI